MSALIHCTMTTRALPRPAVVLLALCGALGAFGVRLPAAEGTPTAEPLRRPIPITTTGWVRLTLDADAQAQIDTAWLSDSEGRAVPFLRAHALADRTPLAPVEQLVTGRNGAGHATAEFALAASADAAGSSRRVTLSVGIAPAAWAARVEIERRSEGGAWLRLDDGGERRVYDFGPNGRRLHVDVPLAGTQQRLTLVPEVGTPPAIERVSVQRGFARTERVRLVEVGARRLSGNSPLWTLTASRPLRVVGVEVRLTGSVAPVAAGLQLPEQPRPEGPLPARPIPLTDGWLWNLPALTTAQAQLTLAAPILTDRLELRLPADVDVGRVFWRVEEETWLFPAESGATLWLRAGGSVRSPSGDLTRLELPADEATLPVVTLGPPQPDPAGRPTQSPWSRTRLLYPWVITAVVLLVAAIALRLLRPRPSA